MRKAALAVSVLGFALAFAGCRDVTPDLHDIYTVTLNPLVQMGECIQTDFYGAVNGSRAVVLQTDVWGMIPNLPNPQWGKWSFACPTHRQSCTCGSPGCHDGALPCECCGFIDDLSWPCQCGPDCAGDFVMLPGVCEYHGCTDYSWTFELLPGGPEFGGWFTGAGRRVQQGKVFRSNDTIHARWITGVGEEIVPGSIAARLEDLPRLIAELGPGAPADFTFELRMNEYIRPRVLDFGRPVTITLRMAGNLDPDMYYYWDPVLSIRGMGAMFTVRNGTTLILEDIQLWGADRNYTSIIVVGEGGTVRVRDRTLLTGNNAASSRFGGAVTVERGGTLMLEGGMIQLNTFTNPFVTGQNVTAGGGGVWVRGGEFIMSGGIMEENVGVGGGGAVRVSHGGTFTMTGGLIYDNASFAGGGVFIEGSEFGDSRFIMRGGYIENNFGSVAGAGVAVREGATFEMHGGLIWFNEGNDGVGVDNNGTFVMRGGYIALNMSTAGGTGGVANWSNFDMWAGHIAYNDGGLGGGVRNASAFQMFGGFIMGNMASGPAAGIINIGDFRMFGGQINHNFASGQGGGLGHGNVGQPYSGQVLLVDGIVWNNRDMAMQNAGIPGNSGNIHRRSPRPDSVALARRGFYTLERPVPPGASLPPGWTSGPAPVFMDGIVPAPPPPQAPGQPPPPDPFAWYFRPGSVIPAAWPYVRTIYFFASPELRYPLNWGHVSWTDGRPRVEYRNGVPTLAFSSSVMAIDDGNPARGGIAFPMSLMTLTARRTDMVAAWVVTNGHIRRIDLPLADAPSWPDLMTLNSAWIDQNFPLTPAQSWPWVQAGAAFLPFEQEWHPPMLVPEPGPAAPVLDPGATSALRQRVPDLDDILEVRRSGFLFRQPTAIEPTKENMMRQRRLEFPDQQAAGLPERLERAKYDVIERQQVGRR